MKMFFSYIKVFEKVILTQTDIIKCVILLIDRTVIICQKRIEKEEVEKSKTDFIKNYKTGKSKR